MNHLVLARKWRPKRFRDLVGQSTTVTVLQNIISSQRLHHAYLLTGTRGVGKTTIARIIAKALNCLDLQNNEPCCNCENCLQIDSGRFVDVIEIDAASNTGVDNIREVLENAQYVPTAGSHKIYIIDEVHMLSKSAFNAMLKTLEEPPDHVVFILATTDPQKVPITILSRCLQLKLRNLAAAEIEQHLAYVLEQEQVGFASEALALLANAAQGSMRDALSLTDQAIAFANGTISSQIVQQMLGISDDGAVFALLEAIVAQNSPDLISRCQQLNNSGSNLENLLEQLNYALFQIALAQLSPHSKVAPELAELAKQISLQDCQLYFEISNLGLEQIRKAPTPYPIFTMTLLRMVAFRIGSEREKQILVSAANTKISHSQVAAATPTVTAPDKVKLPEPVPVLAAPPVLANTTPHPAAVKNTEPPPWDDIAPSEGDVDDVEAQAELVAPELATTSPQPPTPVAPASFDGNWLAFVSGIELSQYSPSLGVVLRNAAPLEIIESEEIHLTISDSFRQLVTQECVDTIEQILWQRFAIHFDVNFNFSTEENQQSLKSQEITQAKLLQQTAEESLKNDPIIQDLVSNFSAKILPNTIKPL